MQNKGSSTVEMTIIMGVFLISIALIVELYITVLARTRNMSTEVQDCSRENCTIETTVKNLRRWQWVDEKI